MTLRLLNEHGYDRLTIDDVASEARASKTTLYRRWPSKSKLVLAAVLEAVRLHAHTPDTGSLRGDLLLFGNQLAEEAPHQAPTIRAILIEAGRDPSLRRTLEEGFLAQRRTVVLGILHRAVERGEIAADAVEDELWDLMPNYLIFRSMVPGRAATRRTVEALVDTVIIPSLTRHR